MADLGPDPRDFQTNLKRPLSGAATPHPYRFTITFLTIVSYLARSRSAPGDDMLGQTKGRGLKSSQKDLSSASGDVLSESFPGELALKENFKADIS